MMTMQPHTISTRFHQRGINLIELMIAMAIGVFLLLGLSTVFVNSSKTQRELEYTGQLIENGRYGIEMLYQDVRHAGAFGYLVSLDAATVTPDPCSTTESVMHEAVKLPLHGFDTSAEGTEVSVTGCGSLLTSANLTDGSDVLVVRRANTNLFTGTPEDGAVYIQSNIEAYDIQIGNDSASVPTDQADNGATPVNPTQLEIMKKDNATRADTRLFETHIYFVAPCTVGSGTNGVCQGGDDNVPALKRLWLTTDGSSTEFQIEPLVEGVEYFQVEYGIDNSPTAEDSTTGEEGDGVPDVYKTIPASLTEWSQVAAVRIYMLVRSNKSSTGYTDEKVYTLGNVGGGVTISAKNDAFKRHVFSAEAQISNIAGRREIP